MRTHKEIYNINANKETIFNVIANIENYPTFLPWCIGARITDKNHLSDIVIQRAELVIAFKSFRESFFSDKLVISVPLIIIVPSVGLSKLPNKLRREVFPAPDDPIIDTKSPF